MRKASHETADGQMLKATPVSASPPRSSSIREYASGNLGVERQQALGNRAVSCLLNTSRAQLKLRIGMAGDVFEQEADRVAQSVVAKSHPGASDSAGLLQTAPAGVIQRKCAKCEEEEEETLRRSPKDGAETATAATATPTAAEQGPPEPAAEKGAGATLLVADEAERVGPGQMRKGEFLAALREAVCATVNEGLASTGRTTEDCPWVEYWFSHAAGKDAAYVEKAIRKYAPEASRVRSAQEYIPIVTARVRRSVDVWVKTGKITGVPEGVSTEAPGAAPAEAGGQASQGGGVLFKARPGGPRAVSDPQAIRDQLGGGHPLPGGVRSRMESAFGLSFSHVRIHTDSGAAALSDQLNARAFTVGEHVAFGPSEYRPGTLVGDALLAHELAHVVQQGAATAGSGPLRKSEGESGSLEEDADRSAIGAVVSAWGKSTLDRSSRKAAPRLTAGLRLQRCRESQEYKRRPQEYHGAGGALHAYVYEPLREDYANWISWGLNLPSKWGEEVPVAGHAAGAVVGFIPWLFGNAGSVIVGVPQFLTPKTEEEHFLTVVTLGAGTPAVRLGGGVKYGWWWLKNLFKRNPSLATTIEKQAPTVLNEVVETVEKKAPTVIEEVSGRPTGAAKAATVEKEAAKQGVAEGGERSVGTKIAAPRISLREQGEALAAEVRSKSGKVGVNLGGTGEEAGFINLNNLAGGQKAEGIPYLIQGNAEDIAKYFGPETIDEIAANNILPEAMNWAEVAKRSYEVLKKGGKIRLAEFGGGREMGLNIEKALKAAGFTDVKIIGEAVVTASK